MEKRATVRIRYSPIVNGIKTSLRPYWYNDTQIYVEIDVNQKSLQFKDLNNIVVFSKKTNSLQTIFKAARKILNTDANIFIKETRIKSKFLSFSNRLKGEENVSS